MEESATLTDTIRTEAPGKNIKRTLDEGDGKGG